MSKLGDLIFMTLGSIFAGRIYPGQAMTKPQAPYAVYTYFGDTRVTLSGTARDQQRTVQIDIYGAAQPDIEALADQVEQEMAAHSLEASPSMFTATALSRSYIGVDPDVRFHRLMLEFSMWYRP